MSSLPGFKAGSKEPAFFYGLSRMRQVQYDHGMRSPPTAIFLAAAALLAGCAGPEPAMLLTSCSAPMLPPAPPAATALQPGGLLRAQAWTCGNRKLMVYPQVGAAKIVENGCQQVLPQVQAASGSRYEDRTLGFWNKGPTAELDVRPWRSYACTENRAASLLEDARVRGVTFRGQGVGPAGQPAWTIEIGPGNVLVLSRDGGDRLVFTRLSAVVETGIGTAAYAGKTGSHSVSARVAELSCTDGGGNVLPGKFELQVDGVAYKGCGHPLSR